MISNWRLSVYGAVVAALVGLGAIFAQQPDSIPLPNQGKGPEWNAKLQALQEQAFKDMSAQDFPDAIAAFEKLVRAAPQAGQVRANLCLAYYSAHRYPEAVAACREAQKLDPTLIPPRYFLTLSLAENGQCGQALPDLIKGFGTAPNQSIERQFGLDGARCALETGDTERAAELTMGLIRKFPRDPDVLYTASHVYSGLANRLLYQLMHVSPNSYLAQEYVAEVMEFHGKLNEAAAEYRRVLSSNPRLPGIHYRLGEVLLKSAGNNPSALQKAREQFEDELRLDPDNAAAEFELGQMAWRARQYDDAVRHLRRAANIHPDSAPILAALGRALVSAGKLQEAITPLEKAVKLDANDPTAHYQLAFALLHLGRKAEADRELAIYDRIHKEAAAKNLEVWQQILGPAWGPSGEQP